MQDFGIEGVYTANLICISKKSTLPIPLYQKVDFGRLVYWKDMDIIVKTSE